MATGIRHFEFLDVSYETGYGVPTHIQLKGSLFVDVDEPNLYQNQDGFNTWSLVSSGGSGGTASDSFSVFSANTGTVTATGPNQTIIYSGINVNILTNDTNKVITFSAGTGGGGGGSPSANTYVDSFVYNGANKLTITRNDAVSFDVNLNTFSGITVNGDLLVTGDTIVNNLTANTIVTTIISADTYYGDGSNLSGVVSTNLIRVTGARNKSNQNNIFLRYEDGVPYNVNPYRVYTDATITRVVASGSDLDTWNAHILTGTTISTDSIYNLGLNVERSKFDNSVNIDVNSGTTLYLYMSGMGISYPKIEMYIRNR